MLKLSIFWEKAKVTLKWFKEKLIDSLSKLTSTRNRTEISGQNTEPNRK